jgi:hypothetical protein
MPRSPFAKPAPLTPRQRKKGLVLPLSEPEAQVLRALLGASSDKKFLPTVSAFPAAERLLAARLTLTAGFVAGSITKAVYDRLNRACERRALPR